MAHKNKARGNRFEVWLRETAIASGFEKSVRAWGSDGRSMGWPEDVDVLVQTGDAGQYPVQAKVRKTLPAYLQITEGVEAVAFKQDRGPTLVLIGWDSYLDYCRLRDDESTKDNAGRRGEDETPPPEDA